MITQAKQSLSLEVRQHDFHPRFEQSAIGWVYSVDVISFALIKEAVPIAVVLIASIRHAVHYTLHADRMLPY